MLVLPSVGRSLAERRSRGRVTQSQTQRFESQKERLYLIIGCIIGPGDPLQPSCRRTTTGARSDRTVDLVIRLSRSDNIKLPCFCADRVADGDALPRPPMAHTHIGLKVAVVEPRPELVQIERAVLY